MKLIKSLNLTLRELCFEDDIALLEIFNSDAVGKYINKISNIDSIHKLIERKINKYKDSLGANFVIIENDSQKIVGNADFKVDVEKKIAEFGYVINEKYWNKGFATQATIILIKYAFEELNLDKVIADARQDNVASNKILSNKLNMKLDRKEKNEDNEVYNHYVLDKQTYFNNINKYEIERSK